MDRQYIYYEITCEEPLIAAENSQIGNLIVTKDCIPGNTILGLLAGRYLQSGFSAYKSNGKQYDEEFKSLFLSDEVLYLNAYPIHHETQSPSLPMPMSVFGCKYYGDNTFNSKTEEHGLRDMTFTPVPVEFKCPKCGSENMKHKDGYLYHYEGELKNLKVPKRIDTRVNVDGELLYSLEAVEKGTRFYGCIAVKSENFTRYFERFNELLFGNGNENLNFRIGKVRNRGYGLLTFNTFEERPFPLNTQILPGSTQFSIYCYEDLILKNPLGQYYTYLAPEFILGSSGPQFLEFRSDLSFWKNTTIAGFNNKRKMPLNRELLIARGSVFVYDIKMELPPGEHELPEYIGIHQNSGFGRVIYNHTRLKD